MSNPVPATEDGNQVSSTDKYENPVQGTTGANETTHGTGVGDGAFGTSNSPNINTGCGFDATTGSGMGSHAYDTHTTGAHDSTTGNGAGSHGKNATIVGYDASTGAGMGSHAYDTTRTKATRGGFDATTGSGMKSHAHGTTGGTGKTVHGIGTTGHHPDEQQQQQHGHGGGGLTGMLYGSGSSNSGSSEDDGQKKGLKEKTKENSPDVTKKHDEPQHITSTAPITTPLGTAGYAQQTERHHEKKGMMEMIKEKLHGGHH